MSRRDLRVGLLALVGLLAIAESSACAPSYGATAAAPRAREEPSPDAGAAMALAGDALDAALDELRAACARGESIRGECAAKARDACVGMTRVARACFDAAADAKMPCETLEKRAGDGAEERSIGARAAQAVASLCENACETRQNGGRFDEVREALGAICAAR